MRTGCQSSIMVAAGCFPFWMTWSSRHRCLAPVEAKAGQDVVELRRRMGHRLAFVGIMMCALGRRGSREAQGVYPAQAQCCQRGGYVFGADHSVSGDVSRRPMSMWSVWYGNMGLTHCDWASMTWLTSASSDAGAEQQERVGSSKMFGSDWPSPCCGILRAGLRFVSRAGCGPNSRERAEVLAITPATLRHSIGGEDETLCMVIR